jgi:hypothetical protein
MMSRPITPCAFNLTSWPAARFRIRIRNVGCAGCAHDRQVKSGSRLGLAHVHGHVGVGETREREGRRSLPAERSVTRGHHRTC